MKRAFLAILIAAALCVFLDGRDESCKAADSASQTAAARDVQDIIFLADNRPLLFRLHILVDGKPFHDAWDDFIGRLFQYLDLDGDGVLSQQEIDRAPRPQLLQQLVHGNYFNPNAPNRRRTEELDVNLVPGKVKRAGLASYYRLSGVKPLLAFIRDRSRRSDALTAALVRHLDTDRDGRLSQAELLAAASTLRKLDLNDDEVIDREEVLPSQTDDPSGMRAPQEKTDPLGEDSAFLVPAREDAPGRLAYALLQRYDKDKNQKLSRAEFGVEKSVFDQLDRDHDGELDTQELSRFLAQHPPDLEVIVQLGAYPASAGYVYLHNPLGQLVAETRRIRSGSLATTFADVAIDLGTGAGRPEAFQSARQLVLEQFKSADVTKRGYLDRTQGEQNPFLAPLYVSADRNGDGKLTESELTAFLDLLDECQRSSTVLMISDHGRSLFELLNVYHDGRLRQSELQGAWSMLSPWAKGDGLIRQADIPRQFDLLFTQSQPGNFLNPADAAPAPTQTMEQRPAPPSKGPLWFRKMDRNGDGVVTRREFLGSREDFKRIDSNGDGVITPEEAERADALYRKSK